MNILLFAIEFKKEILNSRVLIQLGEINKPRRTIIIRLTYIYLSALIDNQGPIKDIIVVLKGMKIYNLLIEEPINSLTVSKFLFRVDFYK